MFNVFFFFFKQKTAYEMRISDWSSDVCSSDLLEFFAASSSLGNSPSRPEFTTIRPERALLPHDRPPRGWRRHEARMKRYDILDGFRGYFLVFMLVNHLAFQGGSRLAKLNHSELGYVQDAQGFIFIDRKSPRLNSSH